MEPSYNEQQESQSPTGERRQSQYQPTPSRPGTPSQMSPSDLRSPTPYPAPVGSNPRTATLRSPFPNYRPGTPGVDSTRRYRDHPTAAPDPAISQSHPRPGYQPDTNQYSPPQNRESTGPPFFPTPSQAMEYRQYADRHRRSGSVSSPLDSGYNPPSSPLATRFPPAVPPSQHYPSQLASTSVLPANSASTSAGDRSVCPQCDASFSRAHDLRRHFGTHHLESRQVHRCPHCRNEYVRADSLKRHLDTRCDARDNN